jgi:hypothetical protein
MSLLSSMITLPTTPAKGLYSCWNNTYPRVASPTSSDGLSSPVSPPCSPRPSSLIFTLPAGSANGIRSSWQHYMEIASSTGSGNLSPPPMSRPTSPIHHLRPISEVLDQPSSWAAVARSSLPISDQQQVNSDCDSRPTSIDTSLSYSYTVKSVNSRKSRLTVWYPRPVRPQRVSGVDSIPESAATSSESFSPLSSRPVSMAVSVSMPLQGNPTSIADKEVSLLTRVPLDGRVVTRVTYLQR